GGFDPPRRNVLISDSDLRYSSKLLGQIDERRLAAKLRPANLAELTADIAGVFRSAIERAGLTFRVDCPPLPHPVWIDRDMRRTDGPTGPQPRYVYRAIVDAMGTFGQGIRLPRVLVVSDQDARQAADRHVRDVFARAA